MKKKLIFDLGANVGGNIPYYLSKSDKVIALEANPVLCNLIRNKYQKFIQDKSLIIVEACIAIEQNASEVNFFVNKFDSGASSFCPPTSNINDFYSIKVPSVTYESLLKNYGKPDFVKIDLEGYDIAVVNYLIESNNLPDYLQFENLGIETIERIVDLKYYTSFNIVPFYNFSKHYNFSHERNAGPIELDIKSPWLTGNEIIKLYKSLKHSWVDMHLAKENYVTHDQIDLSFYIYKQPLLNNIKLLFPNTLKSKIKSILKISR